MIFKMFRNVKVFVFASCLYNLMKTFTISINQTFQIQIFSGQNMLNIKGQCKDFQAGPLALSWSHSRVVRTSSLGWGFKQPGKLAGQVQSQNQKQLNMNFWADRPPKHGASSKLEVYTWSWSLLNVSIIRCFVRTVCALANY